MKTPVKSLALIAFLSLVTGAAQAEGRNCLLDAPAPTTRPMAPLDMSKIEAAPRAGQITPYEAGRLMRRQWDMAQFQRGFLDGGQAPRAAGPDLGDMAGHVAGGMARNGVQTATQVMRALMRETERLIQEKAAAEGDPL